MYVNYYLKLMASNIIRSYNNFIIIKQQIQMGNSENLPNLEYSKEYGHHIKNAQTIIKYYQFSSVEEEESFRSLLSRYSKKVIPTVLPILNSTKFEHQQLKYGWKLQFKLMPSSLYDEISYHRNMKISFSQYSILRVIDCVLSGLLIFSKERIIHGDIRPKNIFMDSLNQQSNIYKICLPLLLNNKYLEKAMNCDSEDFYYISPDYLSEIHEYRTKPHSYELNDIFSLGIICLQMATLSKVSDFYWIEQMKINSLKIKQKLFSCRLEYSKDFCTLIQKMLEENPSSRFKFSDVYSELNSILLKIEEKHIQPDNQDFSKKQSAKNKKLYSDKKPNIIRTHKIRQHYVEKQLFIKSQYISKENRKSWAKFKGKMLQKSS